MKAVMVFLLTALALLWSSPAQAGDIDIIISNSDGSRAEFTFAADTYRYDLEAYADQTLTIRVSGPADHCFVVNNSGPFFGQAVFQVLVGSGVQVQITHNFPSGDFANYYINISPKTPVLPPEIVEPPPLPPVGDPLKPEPKPDPGSGMEGLEPPPDAGSQSGPEPLPDPGSQSGPAEIIPAEPEFILPREEPPAEAPETDRGGIVLTMRIGSPEMTINGQPQMMDIAPFLEKAGGNDHTMVPIRFIAEGLGATVLWNGATKQVNLSHRQWDLCLTIGQPVSDSGPAPLLRHNRTFVPLRYVMEAMGAQVEWVQADRSIIIRGNL